MYFTQNEESRKSSALLLIDMQKGFSDPIWKVRSNLYAEDLTQILLRFFRQFSGRVIHAQHRSMYFRVPLYPEQAGVESIDEVRPELGERVSQKTYIAHLSVLIYSIF
jgi:nicotinamidase-related amidase